MKLKVRQKESLITETFGREAGWSQDISKLFKLQSRCILSRFKEPGFFSNDKWAEQIYICSAHLLFESRTFS